MKRFFRLNPRSNLKPGHKNAQGMVEFALVMPILILIIYGLLEVGRLVFIYSNVVTAAREGARYGSTTGMVDIYHQYKDCEGIRDAAKNVDFLNAIDRNNITIDYYFDVPDPITHDPVANEYHIPAGPCPAMSTVPTIPGSGLIKVYVTGTFTPVSNLIPLRNLNFVSWSQRTILGRVDVSGSAASPGGGGSNPLQPAVISKIFMPETIVLGETSTLMFTIRNPNDSTAFTNISFSDTYPSGLVNRTPLVTTNNCGGTLMASAGGNSIALSGASLGAYSSCTLKHSCNH